jgi:phosphatidylglycerophosphate synthase
MARRYTLDEVRARTYKDRDAWWTVWLVDPLAARLVRLVAPYRWISPNRLTMTAFVLGLAAAGCFGQRWLLAGAILFHVSFVVDCMDGKVARLTGTGSAFGGWLDYVFDRLRVLACAIALFGAQYAHTGRLAYLWAGGLVIFLDMFRYLNALQIGKVKHEMRTRLTVPGQALPAFLDETGPATLGRPVVDVHGDFRRRFRSFVRVRDLLVRQRIRAHVVSGIEFQMAVFIVGPLTGWLLGSVAVAGTLLIAFEILLIVKLWMATRSQDAVHEGHVGDRFEAGLGVQMQRSGVGGLGLE